MATERVRPIGEMVLIQPEATPKQTAGGIFVPQTTKEKRCRGKVLAVGPGKVLESGQRSVPEVVPGNVVIFLRHNLLQGIERASDEDGPGLIPASEILAVVETVEAAS